MAIHIIGHFKTITAHRHLVISHCKKAGILWQGLRHDLSKYSPSEFWTGARYYQAGKRSPNEREREIYGYSAAWMHHKGRNKHHFEYWTDYVGKHHQVEAVPMPKRYVAEMFCDRVAASKIYQGEAYTDSHPIQYFQNQRHELNIHPKTAEELETFLRMLAEKGEQETFRAMRIWLKQKA